MKVIVVFISFISLFHIIAAVHPTGYLKFRGEDFYVHGINVPWFAGNYGHDVGNNPINHYGVWYNSTAVSGIFKDVATMGFNVMRIWVHEGLEGLVFDDKHMITGIDAEFLKNFDNVVDLAEKYNLYIYLMVMDDGISVNNPIITNSQAQSAYLKNVLIPLVQRYKGRKGIFGVDLFNEIESQIAGNHGNWGNNGCTWDQARSFLSNCVKAIKSVDSSRLVSSSSGWHGYENVQSGLFSGLGFDFYDYHSYSADGKLPGAKSVKSDLPVIVGECGPTITTRDDSVCATVDYNYMMNAALNEYAGSMVWAYGEASNSDVFSFINADGSHREVFSKMEEFNHSID